MGLGGSTGWSHPLLLLGPIALAVGATLAAHGGFFPRGQVAFAVLALGAAVVAAVAVGAVAPAAGRLPVLVLVGLGALSAASAAWTTAEPEAALRWGGVVTGYGLIAFASCLAAARLGAIPVAILIAVAAVAAGVVGLYGAGARAEPLAQRLGGQWSPGGPFEYSPALGLAQVSALPILLAGAGRPGPGPRWTLPAGAAGLAVAGASLALVGSRVQLAIAAAVAGGIVAFAPRALGTTRSLLAGAAALALAAGGFADAVAGSYAEPFVEGGDAPRLLGLAAIVVFAPPLWLAQRRLLGGEEESGSNPRYAAAVIAPVAAALALAAATPDSGPRAEPVSGFTHGRAALWGAAVDTALDRPLAGSGAQSFFEASLPHQDPPAVRFAHNLPLENWAELGTPGAGAILLLYGLAAFLVVSAGRSPPAADAAWLLGPAIIAFLASNLFDWPWHVPASGAIFSIALGGLAGALRAAPRRSRSGPGPA